MKAAGTQFTSVERPVQNECEGCIFDRERSTECHQAEAIAKRLEIPTCEDRAENGNSYIYVLTKIDPRQLSLIAEEKQRQP